MKARVHITVSCEADGCERETEATAELNLSVGQSVSFNERGDPGFVRQIQPGFRNLRFPPSPTGEPSGWRCDERGAWCPGCAAPKE